MNRQPPWPREAPPWGQGDWWFTAPQVSMGPSLRPTRIRDQLWPINLGPKQENTRSIVVRFRVSLSRSDHQAPGQIDHMLPARSVLSYQSALKHLGVPYYAGSCPWLLHLWWILRDLYIGHWVTMDMVVATVLPGAERVWGRKGRNVQQCCKQNSNKSCKWIL